jgi:hypothetical protein
MNTLYKVMVVIIVIIGIWIALACKGYCDYEISPQCHVGQHTCNTDAECEEEEAYFLDLDELHQSDNESLLDTPWVTKTTARQPSTPTNLEVK